MAVTFDAASNSTGSAVSSVSWSHAGASGAFLIVGSNARNATTTSLPITGVTYNGVSGTKITSKANGGGDNVSEIWRVDGACDGSAHTIQVTYTGTVTYIAVGAISITGQNSTPLDGSAVTNNGFSSTASTNITTTVANDLIVDIWGHNSPGTDSATGTNQTVRVNVDGGDNHINMSTMTTTSAGTYTPSWSSISGKDWEQIVIAIQPSSGPTTTIKSQYIGGQTVNWAI